MAVRPVLVGVAALALYHCACCELQSSTPGSADPAVFEGNTDSQEPRAPHCLVHPCLPAPTTCADPSYFLSETEGQFAELVAAADQDCLFHLWRVPPDDLDPLLSFVFAPHKIEGAPAAPPDPSRWTPTLTWPAVVDAGTRVIVHARMGSLLLYLHIAAYHSDEGDIAQLPPATVSAVLCALEQFAVHDSRRGTGPNVEWVMTLSAFVPDSAQASASARREFARTMRDVGVSRVLCDAVAAMSAQPRDSWDSEHVDAVYYMLTDVLDNTAGNLAMTWLFQDLPRRTPHWLLTVGLAAETWGGDFVDRDIEEYARVATESVRARMHSSRSAHGGSRRGTIVVEPEESIVLPSGEDLALLSLERSTQVAVFGATSHSNIYNLFVSSELCEQPRPPTAEAPVGQMRTVILEASLLFFVVNGANGSFDPFLAVALGTRGLGASTPAGGLLLSLRPVAALVATPFWTALADRTGRHSAVASLCAAAASLSCLAALAVVAVAPEGLLLAGACSAMALMSVFRAPLIPLLDSAICRALGPKAKDYGRVRLWGALGYGAAGTAVGSLVIPAFGDLAGFAACAAELLCAAAMYRFFLQPRGGTQGGADVKEAGRGKGFWYSARAMFAQRGFACFAVSVGAMGCVMGTFASFASLHLRAQPDVSKSASGWSVGIAMLSELPFFLASRRLLDALGVRALIALAHVAFIARAVGFACLRGNWLLLPQALHGASFACLWMSFVYQANAMAPPEVVATAQGVVSALFSGLGYLVANMCGGMVLGRFDLYELARGIVPLLNQSPFNKQLTLVAFDQLGPQQLLSLLADVFREISPDYNVDIRNEMPEATAERMRDALVVLGFKVPDDQFGFLESLQSSSKEVVYPVMLWLLHSLQKHRAYLARFLVPLQVPEELLADETYKQYKAMMDEFREVHKELTAMRDAMATIDGLKQEHAKMQQEQATLVQKLDRARRKVGEVPGGTALLSAAGEVRAQLDDRRHVADQLAEQKDQLVRAKDELLRVSDSLKEVEAASTVGTDAHIAQLEEEARTNKYVLGQELPQEIAALREWKSLLEEVLGEETITEATRAMLHQELTQLRASVKELTQRRAQQQQPSDEQLGVHRQQAAVFDRKKDELLAQLKTMQEELEAQKQKVDEAKGKTLAEISKIVAEISDTLQEQKTKLAPLAKELRTLRNKYQEIESEHSEKKKEHDSLMLQIENERGKTEMEKKAYLEDWFREESRFHYNSCMIMLNNVQLSKANETALPREEKTYQDVYAQRSKYLGQQIEIWRSQQKALKETAEPSLNQARQFNDLKKLMTLKLEILKKPKGVESRGVQEGGVDRMVIS
eukprot:m51a1_g4559 putative intraflagellar transport protein 81 homolog (1332) ;mRNA; r:109042-114384